MILYAVWLSLLASAQEPVVSTIDKDAIDRSCKPCDDFFQFAIGAWHARNPIPPSKDRWGKNQAAADGNLEVLQTILSEVSARKNLRPGSDERKVADFYGSCMDEAAIEKEGAGPVQPYLKRIAGVRTKEAFLELTRELEAEAIGHVLFGIGPRPDSENPRETVAAIAPAILGLPDRDYYFQKDPQMVETRKRYVAMLTRLFELAGVPGSAAKAESVLALETKLAEPRLPRVALRNPLLTNNRMSWKEAQALAPSLDLQKQKESLEVGGYNGIVIVQQPKYQQAIERLLTEVPLEDWKTLAGAVVLRGAAESLSKDFVDAHYAFYRAWLQGRAEQDPRWKRCAASTDAGVPDPLGKLYAAKVFPPEAKARMQELVANLRKALEDNIQALEWMTPATKQRALQKLATFEPLVGYPDKWRDYSGLNVGPDGYFANRVASAAYQQRDALRLMGKPFDRTRWGMTVPTWNAYYSPLLNQIVFPAGILQAPMFSLSADDAVNYGAIGAVIGHEISHGFDDSGSRFDDQGRLKNWWTDEDRKAFESRAQCVVEQFQSYEVEPGLSHNGKLVLGESIGDLGGLSIAYSAYMRSLRGKPRPKDIDGFSPEQRFFLSFAQSWGAATRIEKQRLLVRSDPHPVSRWRVIGPLSNFEPFHRAFACKRGDKMVRTGAQLCKIW